MAAAAAAYATFTSDPFARWQQVCRTQSVTLCDADHMIFGGLLKFWFWNPVVEVRRVRKRSGCLTLSLMDGRFNPLGQLTAFIQQRSPS
jgi:hypothetical protein